MSLLSAIQRALALLHTKRRQADGMEYCELVMPMADEPHICGRDETDIKAAELDEEMFCEWYKRRVYYTKIILSENVARKLFQIKDRVRQVVD